MYLYRAVNSQGSTLEFLLSATRDAQAAKRFFAKALHASHTVTPRVITVDKNAAYPKALKEMKAAGKLAASCELRQSKYLNNEVEQDHRFIKRLVKPGLGFFSFQTAWNTLQGYESMHMIRKGQIHGIKKGTSLDRFPSLPACLDSSPKHDKKRDCTPIVFPRESLQHSQQK
ncbi:hypothetical protein KSC_022340 [Ktedonobacter sp. SOSP1-52]|nr:hypothetical protein KSC_022340 [Ktedonobacter sp. SOSP1-52]